MMTPGSTVTRGIWPRSGLSGTHGPGALLQSRRDQAEQTNLAFQGGEGELGSGLESQT